MDISSLNAFAKAVITTFATFGSEGAGRIFGRTLIYTLLTTFAAAIVGALLYVVLAPGNLSIEMLSQTDGAIADAPQQSYYDHILSVIPNNIVKAFLEGNVLSLLLLACPGVVADSIGRYVLVYTIIDMVETAENVWSDSCVCAMTDHDLG